jgi:hypothetical protein
MAGEARSTNSFGIILFLNFSGLLEVDAVGQAGAVVGGVAEEQLA